MAAGQLDSRVNIRTGDEFSDLGDAFNTMANRLVELQEDIKRQERQATIGRIAAGLVHDLAHPIQNLGNSSRLLVRNDLDAESRLSIRATIERELENLKRFMDDLRHVVKPRPVERFLLEVNGSLAEVVEAMRTEGARVGVTVETRYAPEPMTYRRRSIRAEPRLPHLIRPTRFRLTEPGGGAASRDDALRRTGGDWRDGHRLRDSCRSAYTEP